MAAETVKRVAFKYLVLLMLSMSIVLVFGDIPCEAAENSRTFSFYFENDLFADTDQGYNLLEQASD